MSKIYKQPPHCKGLEEHQKYLSRITKTLYYGNKLPKTEMLSLPATELAVEIFSEVHKGKSLNRLQLNTAAQISRNACVSPCSLVLAMLYFDRLKKCNMDYLERTVPSDLFLVSLMVSSKFLFDDGEIDEVFMDEWAASSGMTCRELAGLERDFLNAINWELYTNDLIFWKKLGELEMLLALKEGNMRGYFTYTELGTLSELIYKDFHNLVQCVVALSVVLAVTYATALLVLFGSVALASAVPGTSLYNYQTRSLTNESTVVGDNVLLSSPVGNENKLSTKHQMSNFNAVKVFKASILLASIKTEPLNGTDSQTMTWDWWNVPIMNWLTNTAQLVKTFELPSVQNYIFYLETTVTNDKLVYLEDHIQKATKTRMQDQLERSWHAEWTDTIKNRLSYYSILPYLQSIKT